MLIENKMCTDRQTLNYNKNFFNLIKSIAIALMVIHHLYGFPDWHISEETIQLQLISFALISNICVGLFAFITGWTYAIHKDKSFKYSMKKILGFVSQYWIMLFFLTVLAVVFCGYSIDFNYVISELFCIDRNVVIFAWYVIFYVEIMLILPIVAKLTEKKSAILSLLMIIIIYICFVPFYVLDFFEFIPTMLIKSICNWLPVVLCGYWLSRFDVMKVIYNCFCKVIKNNYLIKIILGCVLIILSFALYKNFLYTKFISNCFIYAPMFVFGVYLFKIHNYKTISTVTRIISKHSVNIWFFHSIFFSKITRDVFQPILFIVNSPIITVIWCFVMGIFVSMLLNLIYKYTWAKLEKGLFK